MEYNEEDDDLSESVGHYKITHENGEFTIMTPCGTTIITILYCISFSKTPRDSWKYYHGVRSTFRKTNLSIPEQVAELLVVAACTCGCNVYNRDAHKYN